MSDTIAFIGFGEAGQAFASAAAWSADACAYDRLTDGDETRNAKEADYRRIGIAGRAGLAEAIEEAAIVLSLVTADQALEVARAAARHMRPGAMFCDMNSVAPATKRSAAAALEEAGVHYVDVAIMSPVNPARLAVPLLVSGPEAATAVTRLTRLGFSNCRRVGADVGEASSIKMIRSVIVKGIEALTAEAMLAADAAGVAEEVLASLDASDKGSPWAKRADYSLDRMIIHGLRRAEEMEEVVKTLEDLGVEPLLTRQTARRQREIGTLRIGTPATGLPGKIEQISARKADAA